MQKLNKLIFLSALILAAVLSCILSACNNNNSGGRIADFKDVDALSINDIQSDPLSFIGEIKINGVAAAFSADDETLFGIKDTTELMFCKDLYCDAYMLPAKYSGGNLMPEIADIIDFIGTFTVADGAFYFEISDFEVKRNIKNLLSNTRW